MLKKIQIYDRYIARMTQFIFKNNHILNFTTPRNSLTKRYSFEQKAMSQMMTCISPDFQHTGPKLIIHVGLS